MAIERKIYERVLNMAQMFNIGVLNRGPNMIWTCRWNEADRESSVNYQIVPDPPNQSLKMRLRYIVTKDALGAENAMDYSVSLRTSLSYKGKTWYWFVCPLVINGTACKRRVRNLYFLPSSEFFGCKHCRDMMTRSLPLRDQWLFRQTLAMNTRKDSAQAQTTAQNPSATDLKMGWKPASERIICKACGCLSEGKLCCNCGEPLNGQGIGDYFHILGVRTDATPEEIRVGFMSRLKEYHPDRVAHLGPKLREVAEKEIKQINLAYETLRDPGRLRDYLREKDLTPRRG